MHMLESSSNLSAVLPHFLLWEAHVLFNSFLHYELEVSFLGPLDGNEELVELVVDEPVEVPDDVWMV
jgi:hypothetical protein